MGKTQSVKAVLALCGLMVLTVLSLAHSPIPDNTNPVPPVVLPKGALHGKTIVVDAGHGGEDGGARARTSRVWEKELNLSVAKKVRDALEKQDATVLLTREKDMAFDKNKRKDLTARMDVASKGNADMLLSIHMNEYRSARESGPQVFYTEGNASSRLLAGALQAALIDVLSPKKERVAMAGDYFILSLPLPCVLIECGFISNPQEEALLLKDDYQTRLAHAIAQGVIQYYALPKLP